VLARHVADMSPTFPTKLSSLKRDGVSLNVA
jgi:hypothetical protein